MKTHPLDRFQPLSQALFRAMLSTIFIVAGLNHLTNIEGTAQRLAAAPGADLATWIASPTVLVILSGVPLLIGGLALLAGFLTRWAAIGLLLLLIPITLTVQVGDMSALGPLFKNVGLAGGLLYFIAHGSLHFAFDSLLLNKKQRPSQLAMD